MNYAGINQIDTANGKGVRVSLFVSGCPHHCPGCFNPETWDYDYGKPFDDSVIMEILEYLKPDYISGLTVLGGEPLAVQNRKTVERLLKIVKKYAPGKSIWVYTGYVLEDLLAEGDETILNIFELIDVLVDGPFIQELKDVSLPFRGSSNQRIINVKKH